MTFTVNPAINFPSMFETSWEEEVAMAKEAQMIENVREEGDNGYDAD
jgi:hypothetical protein